MMKSILFKSLALSIALSSLIVAEEKDLIVEMKVDKNVLSCAIHPQLREQFFKCNFFVEYDEDINLEAMSYEVLSLPLICNVFSLVWFSGDDYYVDSMDKGFFESLERLKQLVRVMYPKNDWSGNIIPRKLIDMGPPFRHIPTKENKKAMLFSGGLDSTSSFFEHKNEQLHLITAWGQPDMPLKNKKGFLRVKNYVDELVQHFGHTNSYIRSSYCKMFDWKKLRKLYPGIKDWRLSTIEGMSWAGLTLPILIAKKCSTLYMAGGYCWYYNSFCADNPFFTGCINFGGYNFIWDQFDKTRFKKTELIVSTVNNESLEKPFIQTCFRRVGESCGKCWKCCSTMVSLIALGEDINDYGFSDTEDQAVSSTIVLLRRKLSRWAAWSFIEIQHHAKKSIVTFPEKKDVLEPFLTYDMSTLRIDWNGVYKIDWYDVQEVVPWVNMPKNLDEELLSLVP